MDLSRRRFSALVGGAFVAAAVPLGAFGQSSRQAVGPAEYLDPELRAAARQILASGGLNLSDTALPEIRRGAAVEAPLAGIPVAERRVSVGQGHPDVLVFVVNADAGRAGQRARPAILHTHGGGHVLGSVRGELRFLQQLARELDCVVVSVEYRLAPETRYTGSVEDTYAGLRWMHGAAEELGIDRARIAVMGESAGGTHAALLAIAARDRGEVPVCFQCLVYPMLDDRTGSTRQVPPWIGAVLWDPAANRYGWSAFLGTPAGGPGVPAAAVPARVENLAGLPPAWIGVGGADLFVQEDIAYAERLTAAGVPTELLVVPRAFHAFDRIVPEAEVSLRFTEAKMAALRRAFTGA
ncbi:MAG: alpha/beta hydrolase [Sphingomonadales bacterium 32-68-7]|nr:MAG: alpha/beta hydrolase [Sphingomonadales bacterium 12-68-11]OYX08714.1 MAG: alpha/beta hydrolase [Sphingomonadales bacterium 32-68-7]